MTLQDSEQPSLDPKGIAVKSSSWVWGFLFGVPAHFACWWLAWMVFELLIDHPSSRYFDADDPGTAAIFSAVFCIPFGIVSIPITRFWTRRWRWRRWLFLPVLNISLGGLTGLTLYAVHRWLCRGGSGWYGNPSTDLMLWAGSGLVVYHVGCLTLAMLADRGRTQESSASAE